MVAEGSALSRTGLNDALSALAIAAEDRGKDASGVVIRSAVDRQFRTFKSAAPLGRLWHGLEVRTTFARQQHLHHESGAILAVAAHSRLVTNGSQLSPENNHPITKDGVIGIHNGIIVNEAELWRRYPCLTRTGDVDTEVLLALVRQQLSAALPTAAAIASAARMIEGTLSACLMFADRPELAVLTNCGSMYVLTDDRSISFFCSERYPLAKVSSDFALGAGEGFLLRQVTVGTGTIFNLDRMASSKFNMAAAGANTTSVTHSPWPVQHLTIDTASGSTPLIRDVRQIAVAPEAARLERLLETNADRINALRRCSRCILPATFPFIEFDSSGVCSYCRQYRVQRSSKTLADLRNVVDKYRRAGGESDCIVPFSGGRDSTFTLHFVKRELGLKPIAFTYDWGMVTDLGRRNIARVCGKLGVENVIVAADIRQKRQNIRKNILAWLRRPHLGMVPLFMAGDKFFYHYTARLCRQSGVNLNIWGINPLENTDFKVGFLGVPPDPRKEYIYSLDATRKLRLLAGVTAAVLRNPAYLNASLTDSLGSFASRSLATHKDYFHLFDYIRWDESEVETLVRDEFEWETAVDTRTTWRVGDGTAAFYNYIYYNTAGFSEHDTFRSNQVRENMLTREAALLRAQEDNRPRYPTIKWYTELLGLDYELVIRRINEMPKLY